MGARGRRAVLAVGVAAVVVVMLGGCRRVASDRPIGIPVEIKAPLGLPPVPIPADNPPTVASIALGRRLFYDRRLSKDDTVACAFCHNPDYGFTDGMQISRGVGGMRGVRNAPTVLNAAYFPLQFWDGRAVSLEEQAASPLADPVEMNQTHEVSVLKLAKDPKYKTMFADAFGPGPIDLIRVERALASFERTLLVGDSAFDRFEFGGDKSAMSASQIRGLALFKDPHKGNCAACHTIDAKYALFTDGKFHNIGEGVADDGAFKDVGRYHLTQVATDQGAFKTPTLRNVATTPPYMHDGGLKTLHEVVDFYAGGGNSNPYLDKEIRAIQLSGQDRLDLVDFLKALTGPLPPNAGPPGKE